ncbi:UxaA family hydrolase [Sodalis sp. dw_96]|uniref:UxaA family hydrolase n=1 Tax=Sodalis sp. dw_96 TaxID=2719794 RepID=UPI001BD4E762|nr:UxaA family hydrolase [Sodalis sp. dw_96]
MKNNAVVINDRDNVAVALVALRAGENATVAIDNRIIDVSLRQDVPFGHKFAISDIALHGEVYKYGESIGRSTAPIQRGEYVHVHNVESERGRGDWQ